MSEGLTLQLGRFISALRYDDIPAAALAPIRLAFADTVGVTIAGAWEEAPRLVKSMLAPAGGEATLLGGQGRASALDAAWINGTAAHALDFDDVSQRAFGHASAFLVPAILAQGEAVGADGRALLTAYAAAYEAIADLARRDADVGRYHEKGWHPTGVFGALGAAAACASLLRLSPEQCAMALGLAGSQACGLIVNAGTMTKPFHAGRAAHAGVASAQLVSKGFTAAVDSLEHAPGFLAAFSYGGRIDTARPSAVGVDWQICGGNRISVKQYPTCYCTHRAIDGMFDLVRAHAIRSADVERIAVSVSRRNAVILRNHAPRTALEAKFSIEFAVVAPTLASRMGLAELSDDFVLRPDVQALMQRVEVVADDRDNPERPGYAANDRVEVFLRDGRHLDSGPIAHARGDHEHPLSNEALWAKFDDCLASAGMRADAERLFAGLMNLDRIDRVADLMALMNPTR